MFFNYLHVFVSVVCLSINTLTQVFIFRYAPKFGLLRSEYLGFITGFLSVFLFEFYIFLIHSTSIKDFIAIFITNLITYSLLGYCYFHFINLGETARRIRIIREIYDSRDGLTMEEILKRYNAKEVIERRVVRLINSGQVVYKDGRFYLGSPVILFMARIIAAMKLSILGKKNEFDNGTH